VVLPWATTDAQRQGVVLQIAIPFDGGEASHPQKARFIFANVTEFNFALGGGVRSAWPCR